MSGCLVSTLLFSKPECCPISLFRSLTLTHTQTLPKEWVSAYSLNESAAIWFPLPFSIIVILFLLFLISPFSVSLFSRLCPLFSLVIFYFCSSMLVLNFVLKVFWSILYSIIKTIVPLTNYSFFVPQKHDSSIEDQQLKNPQLKTELKWVPNLHK